MKKEDLLNEDFLKQFKTGEELNDFLSQLQMDIPEHVDPLKPEI